MTGDAEVRIALAKIREMAHQVVVLRLQGQATAAAVLLGLAHAELVAAQEHFNVYSSTGTEYERSTRVMVDQVRSALDALT